MLKEAGREQNASIFARLTAMLKNGKKLELLIYGAIILTVAALYIAGLRRDRAELEQKGGEPSTGVAAVAAESGLEDKLSAVLSCIRGAGHVEVMVTYETGTELITAMSTSTNSHSSESDDGGKSSSSLQTTESMEPATVSGDTGDMPIVLMEKQPVVRGVIVVAEGAADIKVKLDLQRAVQAVLDIPLSQIEVFELSVSGTE